MELKFKSSTSEPHSGYGAGSGTIDTTVYFCPCGNGELIRTKDNIPGFRDTDWTLNCTSCAKKYDLDFNTGELTPKQD